MIVGLFTLINRFPAARRQLWKQWYRYLARRFRQTEWVYMNYGLASEPGATAVPLDPQDEADRSWIELYHHVAAAVDLQGRTVLELGSGRGGGASYVKRALKAASVVGVDISDTAIAFCRERHVVPGLSFQHGDAEALPFAEQSFDVVLNVESSHCYGSLPKFLAEIQRVLRPGGHLLYADFRPAEQVAAWRADLQSAGFVEQRHTDITARVVGALDADNDRRQGLLARIVPRALLPMFHQFAGVPGSAIYQGFRERQMVYLSFVLQKQ